MGFDRCRELFGELVRFPFSHQLFLDWNLVKNAQSFVELGLQFVELRFPEQKINFKTILRSTDTRDLA